VLLALLSDFCTPAIANDGYCAQGVKGFEPPRGAVSMHDHLAHLQQLPQAEPPELFGLHPNASISRNLREMHTLCAQLHRMGEVEGLEANSNLLADGLEEGCYSSTETGDAPVKENSEARATRLCNEILSRLPSDPFDLAAARAKYPMQREVSMNSVLVQELQRFNSLLSLITSTLQSLLRTLSG
jgi:dynein heavy chain, axonemal